MTKVLLCSSCFIQPSQLDKFLTSYKQDACTTNAYPYLWIFFEKLRILEGQPKSFERRHNEIYFPNGFGVTRADAARIAATYRLDDDVNEYNDDDDYHQVGPSPSRLREEAKVDGSRLMTHISQVRCDADPDVIYDSCPELVKKVRSLAF